jgi:pyruvate,water dikinase
MLLQAAGVIVERGGVLSHGAIVARQMGIPAVVIGGAVERLCDGERVVVDGDRGIVLRQRGQS